MQGLFFSSDIRGMPVFDLGARGQHYYIHGMGVGSLAVAIDIFFTWGYWIDILSS